MSKLVEGAFVQQLNNYTWSNELLFACNSSYKKFHSTETALIKVQSDMFDAMDKQQVTLLVMLDLSAAFDTIDHNLLFRTLESNFGISGVVLNWFKSYLDGRKQKILINDVVSDVFNLSCGVPQGSCLGPVLFVLYINSLYDVISKHLPSAHGFADDNQLYLSFRPGGTFEKESAVAMEKCVSDVRKWMLLNRLAINDSKTEVMLVGSRHQLAKVTIDGVKVGDSTIIPASHVKILGVIQDSRLSMEKHVSSICQKGFYQLYRLNQIRKFLTVQSTQTLVHAFVSSNLDYCNSLLYGIPDYLLNKLQRVQNAAARLVMCVLKYDHITGVLCQLHWLPVRFRIYYKILLLTFKALQGDAPSYICNMLDMSHHATLDLKMPHY